MTKTFLQGATMFLQGVTMRYYGVQVPYMRGLDHWRRSNQGKRVPDREIYHNVMDTLSEERGAGHRVEISSENLTLNVKWTGASAEDPESPFTVRVDGQEVEFGPSEKGEYVGGDKYQHTACASLEFPTGEGRMPVEVLRDGEVVTTTTIDKLGFAAHIAAEQYANRLANPITDMGEAPSLIDSISRRSSESHDAAARRLDARAMGYLRKGIFDLTIAEIALMFSGKKSVPAGALGALFFFAVDVAEAIPNYLAAGAAKAAAQHHRKEQAKVDGDQ